VAALRDHELVVRFERLARDVRAIKSYEIDSAYMTPTDGWEVVLYDTDRTKLRGLELQPVELLLDGAQQVLGRVDVTEVGGDGSAVTLRGRDYLADATECNIDPALTIKSKMSIFDALAMALSPVGIDTVYDEADVLTRNIRTGKATGKGVPKSFKALTLEDIKPNPGEGIFEFCNKIAARHGATIQPSISRNAVTLSAPNYTQAPLYRLVRTADPISSANNNILTATARRDFSSFPTVALFTGKHGKSGEAAGGMSQQFDFATLSDAFNAELSRVTELVYSLRGKDARRKPGAPPIPDGSLYRLLYHRDEDSRNPDQLERAARRAIAERLKETLAYSVTVRGHSDPVGGAIWAVDTMVHVTDEICGVDEPLWIEKRTFRNSGQGATTELECWRPASFQIG
jgi:prophage tail gpP-like protein